MVLAIAAKDLMNGARQCVTVLGIASRVFMKAGP
jgi:hypothetical protein